MSANLESSVPANAVSAIATLYTQQNPKSQGHLAKAMRHMPGGNTRASLHYDPFPVVIDRAEANSVYDLDGHAYVDLMNDLTAAFYGHSNPIITDALRSALGRGLNYGGPNVYEERLAEVICSRFASIERVRFCNSGTEANLLACQLARSTTERSTILAFVGGYHGSFQNYLPDSSALNVDTNKLRFAQFNDTDSVRRAVARVGSDLAAIIVEPMIGSGGSILGEADFLEDLRKTATEHGALLIFDEVQTARLSTGGLQESFNIKPDLTTLGKFIGGGLNFGACAGRADILDRMDPFQPDLIPHGGTFNNNILTMVAGSVGLLEIATADAIEQVNQRADRLRGLLQDISQATGIPLQTGGCGSIVAMHFQSDEPKNTRDCVTPGWCRKLVQLELLVRGFYVARRGTINLSVATTDDNCEAFACAFSEILHTHRRLFDEIDH